MSSAATRHWISMFAFCAALQACPAGAADDTADRARAQALQSVESWASRDFAVPPGLKLDAPLRREAEALAAQQHKRVTALAMAWADEEAQQSDVRETPYALALHLVARYLNEFALWQLDTTGEAYDRLMLQALQDPGLCREQADQLPFAALLAAVQRMAPADRSAALSAQHLLLARWGQQRVTPERPAPSLLDRVVAALPALRGLEHPPNEPPLTPVLAWRLLATPARPPEAATCGLVWWELQRAAARKATPAEQMVLARYALVIDAGVAARQPSEPEINASGYPSVAARFEVQGEVVVMGRARAEGPGLEAPRVTARRLTVPGIRGVRPVAFETMLDRASLDRAAKVVSTQRNLDKDAELSFRWILK